MNVIYNLLSYVEPNTIFSVSVSLFVFSLGWLFTVLYDRRKKYKKLKSRTLFLKQSLLAIAGPSVKQSEAYEKLADEISDVNIRNFTFNTITSLNFKFFSSGLMEDVHTFTLKYSKKNAHLLAGKVTMIINSFEVQSDNFEKNYRDFIRISERNEDSWNKSVNQIFRFTDFLLITNDMQKSTTGAFANKYAEILELWLDKRKDENMHHIHQELLLPLRDLCSAYKDDKRALILVPHVIDAINIYENVVSLRLRYNKLFSTDATQIKRHHSTINGIVVILDKIINRRWYHNFNIRTKNETDILILQLNS